MSGYQERFGGIIRLYGINAAERFRQAHFCIVGIGGVGSWVAEALARSGIGELTLIDLDDICITNINRQLPALSSTIGESKVDVMAQRIKDINPECKINVIEDFVTLENLPEVITKKFDYVFDAIDSVNVKTALIAHCKRQKVSVITLGGAGGQTDPTQIQMADLSKTIHDPLLSKVRNQLRRDHNFTRNPKRKFAVDAIFSTEHPIYPSEDGNVCLEKPEQTGALRLDCNNGFGAATHITATFAFYAVGIALKKFASKAVSQ
ncbi:tRNA cyclic N6-threonylcarbamoyladenosine(37) synthase TcdA [Thalassotalea ganghwensis]